MATKSILKTITIKKRPDANRFMRAIEATSTGHAKEVVLSKPCRVATDEDVKNIFGD